MLKIFISHCSKDQKIMAEVSASRKELEKKFKVFCTNDKGIEAGKGISDELQQALKNSDCMIAIITDSYLRSPICIAEISAFWARKKRIIPIIYSDAGENFYQTLAPGTIFLKGYICTDDNKKEIIQHFQEILKITPQQAECIKKWVGVKQNDPDRENLKPFIGSTDVHKNILQYCLKSGITRIQNGGISPEILKNNLSDKKEVYLIGTTEKSILAANTETFPNLLSKGIDIYILVANAGHGFLKDVAAIEKINEDIFSWKDEVNATLEGLNSEFGVTNQRNLKTIYSKAKELAKDSPLGHLYYGNAFNTIRQTIVLGANEEKDLLWAYVTMTLPPQRAADSLSMEINTSIKKSTPFVNALLKHVYAVKELAKRRNSIFEITDGFKFISAFPENFETEENNV